MRADERLVLHPWMCEYDSTTPVSRHILERDEILPADRTQCEQWKIGLHMTARYLARSFGQRHQPPPYPQAPMRRLLFWFSLILIPSSAANAQVRPSVPAAAIFAGMVTSEIGRELLAGATVTLVEPKRVATTDQRGAFRFDGMASGDVHLVAQKIGYRPLRTVVHMDSTRRLDVELELERLLPSELAPVVVEAAPDRQTIDILRRRASGQGTFFLRDVLDSLQGVSVGELLREKGRGAKMIRYPRTGALLLSSGRGFGTISLLPLADPYDSRSPRACYVQVIVDGIRVYAPDAVNRFAPPDLDQFDSARLEAVEFYAGPASTPAEFAGVGAQCGTLVLWTRRSP